MKCTQVSVLVALSVSVPGAALGQDNGLFFNFPNGNVYTGAKPVVIEVWAEFQTGLFIAWGGWAGAVNGDATGSFANPALANPVPPPGTNAGTPGMNVTGIVAGQLHFPPVFFANTANPILIWSAEWSSANLAKRTVAMTTDTKKFGVYSGVQVFLETYDEAQGEIIVVPTPGAILVAPVLFTIASRRPRR